MRRKKSSHASEIEMEDSDAQMESKVQTAISGLPTLQQKIQAIAINYHIIQKRALDQEVDSQTIKIQVKHRKKYQPVLEEIFNIVAGNIDLNDDDFEGVEHLLTEEERQTRKNYYMKKNVEDYWLKAMLTHDSTAQLITSQDEKALKSLTKVDAFRSEDGKKLSLIFHFCENQFFTNSVIKKEFQLNNEQIKRSYGDAIDWREGKNLTMEIVKKKNKKKKAETIKHIKKESFFNIFAQIDLASDHEEQNSKEDYEEGQNSNQVQDLERQYEVCHALYNEIIPKSLEFYLGIFGGMDFGDGQPLPKQHPNELKQEESEQYEEVQDEKPKVTVFQDRERKERAEEKEVKVSLNDILKC